MEDNTKIDKLKPPSNVNQRKKADRRQFEKRRPLTKEEHTFLKAFFYKHSGYSGRDVLYKQLQAHYDKHDTPTHLRTSRRRMWEGLLDKQEVNQLHRTARKTSIAIKPINSRDKLVRAQCDLIIRGGDPARTYKGILCCIDVATRKASTRILKSTTSKAVAKEMVSILNQVRGEMTGEDKKKSRGKSKSNTFSIMMTDNGAEFKAEFAALMNKKNIRQVYGVANKSTSQSLIERFNQTLQLGMEKERTAAGARWYDLVEKHTSFYNDKTNRNLRLKDPNDDMSTFKTYTPNELWQADRATLTRLFNNKKHDLGTSGKDIKKKEQQLKIGDTVRIVDFSKRKSDMSKGFKQNWSKELYTIFKLKKPKDDASGRPTKFYVKNKQGISRDSNGRTIAYTVNDLLAIQNGVESAPDDIMVKEKAGEYTQWTLHTTTYILYLWLVGCVLSHITYNFTSGWLVGSYSIQYSSKSGAKCRLSNIHLPI